MVKMTYLHPQDNILQYICFISNPSFGEDMFKISLTSKHPITEENEINEIYKSGIPTPFKVEFVIETSFDEDESDKNTIYNDLKEYHINPDKEFFKISKNELIQKLKSKFILRTPLHTLDTTVTECDDDYGSDCELSDIVTVSESETFNYTTTTPLFIIINIDNEKYDEIYYIINKFKELKKYIDDCSDMMLDKSGYNYKLVEVFNIATIRFNELKTYFDSYILGDIYFKMNNKEIRNSLKKIKTTMDDGIKKYRYLNYMRQQDERLHEQEM